MFGIFPNQIKDVDGFGPPGLGGIINVKYASFAFNTSGIASGATLFTLPNNAEIVLWQLVVSTAFDGTGTNTLDFGTTGALTQFASALAANATGERSNGFDPTQYANRLGANTPVTVRYNGTSPANGAAVLMCFYIERSK